MGNNSNIIKYSAALLAVLVVVYLVGRKSGKSLDKQIVVGAKPEVNSAISDEACKVLAAKLRAIMSEWYVDADDEAAVLDIWRQVPDAGAARLIYHFFGYHSSFPYYGDLDYFMRTRISDQVRADCRPFAHGIANF